MTAAELVQLWITQARTVVGERMPAVELEDFDGPANAETKYEAGRILMKWRRGYPAQLALPRPSAADLVLAANEIEYTACHDLGHGIAYWLRSLGVDVEQELYLFRGYAGTAAAAAREADAGVYGPKGSDGEWSHQPREQVAETLRAAIGGRWIRPERGFNAGQVLDPAGARAWLRTLVARAVPVAPPPAPPAPAPSTAGLRVLWQLSHHSSSKNDGWSGAPDEARWIREDLTPRVRDACRHFGIELVLVDGDLEDHPEYHADYLAFIAPHYESDTHDEHIDEDTHQATRGGWFWGRARASSSAAADDRLGAIFERHYRHLLARFPDGPDEHEDWTTLNVLDYYAFRKTRASTPGILPELGVGDPHRAGNDGAWLRTHVQDIADVFALTLLEYAGGQLPAEEDDDMDQDTFNRWFDARLAETPEYKNTTKAIKEALTEVAKGITKLANDETIDDAELAALRTRVDKLRTI